jgi:Bifunctional DNA primase/polymerase, N-terminal/Primase C terminal 1 (PriCT-1)
MSPINQRSARINKAGLFSRRQPQYAAHNIATFPVLITEEAKRPAVTNYGKVGLPGSAELASKRQFEDANAFGFMTGPRSKITVLDVDTTDETILANALDQHGQSPLVVRSGSGKFHAYYRHNGERRKIRPWRGLAIDLLGTGGFVVAPPSEVAKGSYSFIQGTLDDLDQLPALRNLDLPQPKQPSAIDGERNNKLWHHCMGAARHVENFDELLDVARTFNDDCLPPLDDSEVIKAAQSAWRKTERGENWVGLGGVVPVLFTTMDQVLSLGESAVFLFMHLQRHHSDRKTFCVANAMADRLGWGLAKFRAARRQLVEAGVLRVVRPGGRAQHDPSIYAWGQWRTTQYGQ